MVTDGPDFLCIGAQKGGTGWLYEQLRSHPDFWMPPVKELHYFDRQWRSPRALEKSKARFDEMREQVRETRDRQFLDALESLAQRPEIDLEGYAALFTNKGAQISGDITPGYSTLESGLIARIAQRFPETRVIFLARDPVQRAWSHLSMWVRHRTIERFSPDDLAVITKHLSRPEVQRRSYPSQIVQGWKAHVRPELFRVYFFDDLQRDPAGVREQIIQFLGGDSMKPSGVLKAGHNPKEKMEKLEFTDAARKHVAEFFAEELKTCASLLGGAAQDWPARYGY